MEKHIEKVVKKYVIATLSSPTTYLVSRHWGNWYFSDDIGIATKAMTKKVAEMIRSNYYYDFGADVELIIVPVEIEYRLINESDK